MTVSKVLGADGLAARCLGSGVATVGGGLDLCVCGVRLFGAPRAAQCEFDFEPAYVARHGASGRTDGQLRDGDQTHPATARSTRRPPASRAAPPRNDASSILRRWPPGWRCVTLSTQSPLLGDLALDTSSALARSAALARQQFRLVTHARSRARFGLEREECLSFFDTRALSLSRSWKRKIRKKKKDGVEECPLAPFRLRRGRTGLCRT